MSGPSPTVVVGGGPSRIGIVNPPNQRVKKSGRQCNSRSSRSKNEAGVGGVAPALADPVQKAMNTNSNANMNSNMNTNVNAISNTKSKVNTNSNMNTNTNTNTKRNTNTGPHAGDQGMPSMPIAVSTPVQGSSSSVPFDPKSILPAKKPPKSLSKLLEASSASGHKPMFFQCIDGNVRATGWDDPFPETTPAFQLSRFDEYIASSTTRTTRSVTATPKTTATMTMTSTAMSSIMTTRSSTQAPSITTSKETTRASTTPTTNTPPTDPIPASTSFSTTDPPKEQFTAFNIPAFPTLAVHNDICFDFVLPRRWCEQGSKCFRIHPLDKKAYLGVVKEERRIFERMRAGGGVNLGMGVGVEEKKGVRNVKVRLPRGAPAKGAPQSVEEGSASHSNSSSTATVTATPITPTSTQRTSASKNDASNSVENWDRITGLHPSKPSPSSRSGRSSTSYTSASSRLDGSTRPCSTRHSSRSRSTAGDTDESSEEEYMFGRRIPRRKEDWETSCDPSGWSDVTDATDASEEWVRKEKPLRSMVAVVVERERGQGKGQATQGMRHPLPSKSVLEPSLAVEMADVKGKSKAPETLPTPTAPTTTTTSTTTKATPEPEEELDELQRVKKELEAVKEELAKVKAGATGAAVGASICAEVKDPKGTEADLAEDVRSSEATGKGNEVVVKEQGEAEANKVEKKVETQEDDSESVIVRHPRPRSSGLCRRSLNGWCEAGYNCPYVHEGLVYDDEKPEPPIPIVRVPESWTHTAHDHIRLRFTSGFEIEEITTGFESTWIYVGNLPDNITNPTLLRLLSSFGSVVTIRRPLTPVSPLVVKVQYTKGSEAFMAYVNLHGTMQYGKKIELRLVMENKQNGSKVKDTVVRLDWEYPHRTIYMGYATKAQAEDAVEKAKTILYGGEYQTVANLHHDLPAVGKVTVKFTNLPPNVTKEEMSVFGEHQGMVTERPNYNEFTMADNVSGIRRMCKQFQGTMVDLEFRPSPYREGRMRAWAYFHTAKEAEEAANNLHGRKPAYLGHTRLAARHIKTISFSIAQMTYMKIAEEVKMLGERVWNQGPGYSLIIIGVNPLGGGYVTLKIFGENMRVLGMLKSEVEHILNGELVVENGGKIAWDDFFGRAQGMAFAEDLQRRYHGTTVLVDKVRRTIRLFGAPRYRVTVRQEILWKMTVERGKKVHVIVLDGRLATALASGSRGVVERLRRKLGTDNLTLDPWRGKMYVRGDEEALVIASDEVTALRETLPYDPAIKKALQFECPVCFNEASPPIHLQCRHAFCRGCLKRYLLAAIEEKFFPLTCLGDGGKCEERIGLGQAKALLEVDEFNRVVEAAFAAHILMRPEEFRFCPTPDCQQVYRAVKICPSPSPGSTSTVGGRSDGNHGHGHGHGHSHGHSTENNAPSSGVFIQCPSCLVRICPFCHTDAHDGLSCAEAGDGVGLFQEWAEKHNVKQCPNCRMGIEKEAGCNHMVCTMCKTHICWVCFMTFPNGDGIYRHMHSKHGDFGLGPAV